MTVPLRFFVGLASGLALAFAIFFGLVYWQLGAPTVMSLWSHDLKAAVWGSPYVVDGKVLIGNEDGVMTVFKQGREKQLLSEINMGSSLYTTPVAANGVLFVNNRERLYAIQQGAQSDPKKVK